MADEKEKSCSICGLSPLSKNEIGISKKMLGRRIENFFCLSCLANYLGTTVEDLNNKIIEFKEQGCTLF